VASKPAAGGGANAKAAPQKVIYVPRALNAVEQEEYDKLVARAIKFGTSNEAAEKYKREIEQESIKEQAQAAKKAKQDAAVAAIAAQEEEKKRAIAAQEEEKKRKRQETIKAQLDPAEAARLEARAKRFAPSG